ncbi:c-type cytochrome [Mucilaginibacter pedocola]|uniref:Cytochrome c domain-containing protein n=1 Tax=Mucilaginibacter pedocola TaxID=1792845 RepID=A0A1S9PL20_9SPHI|nr:cytochrome c [Mucilaginibacter pedocola]OOQ61634.1 hypothetical protein BC343_00730 [Mucilaginibacter pedocola]
MKLSAALTLLVLICCGIIASCTSDAELEFKRYYLAGERLYKSHCQNCHGAKGEGLGTLVPPLTDAAFLQKNKHRLACIVNLGLTDELLRVSGKTYVSKMPANNLPPVDIAGILTYVNNSFGNKTGVVTSDDVAKDLEDCK